MAKFFRRISRHAGGLIAGLIAGVVLALVGNVVIQAWQDSSACSDMTASFVTDIRVMKEQQTERLVTWDAFMERLELVGDPVHDERARPWLMPEGLEVERSVIFGSNVPALLLLGDDLAMEVVRFYAKTQRLLAEVRILASPGMLFASKGDKIWLRGENKATYDEWAPLADQLIDRLEKASCPWRWPWLWPWEWNWSWTESDWEP